MIDSMLRAGRISDFQDIEAITKKIPNMAEREEVEKELYSALITATLSEAITSK